MDRKLKIDIINEVNDAILTLEEHSDFLADNEIIRLKKLIRDYEGEEY